MKERNWRNIFWAIMTFETIGGVLWFLISPKTYGKVFRRMYEGLGINFQFLDDLIDK